MTYDEMIKELEKRLGPQPIRGWKITEENLLKLMEEIKQQDFMVPLSGFGGVG